MRVCRNRVGINGARTVVNGAVWCDRCYRTAARDELREAGRREMVEKSDEHGCWSCEQAFHLIYDQEDAEGLVASPVNCPACGRLNYLPVARHAASFHKYGAEAVRPRPASEQEGDCR